MPDNDNRQDAAQPEQAQATTEPKAPSKKSNRGFASMDKAKQREIASKGGHAAHAKGTAHEFTPDEARVAGRKGGEVVSRDRAHMAAIGREGGQNSHRRSGLHRASKATEKTDESKKDESEPGYTKAS